MGVKKVNIPLPEDVLEILNKMTTGGEKSAYIADAVRAYSKKQSKQLLVRDMIKGYQATARDDLKDLEDWDTRKSP